MGNPLLNTRVLRVIFCDEQEIYSNQILKWIPLTTCIYIPFLGVFAKLRKRAYELRHFCPSDCLSDRIEQLGSHETGNHES